MLTAGPLAPRMLAQDATKWRTPHLSTLGKACVTLDPQDGSSSGAGDLRSCDVLIRSSDAPSLGVDFAGDGVPIRVDLTAYGSSHRLAGDGMAGDGMAGAAAASEWVLQAMTGIADTTGRPDGMPVLSTAPILEMTAGSYAAAGVIAALLERETGGLAAGRSIEVAIYDCGINALATYLPKYLGTGKTPTREGNAHPLAAPWNSYPAADGWVLVCSATDEQWAKLCTAMGCPDRATGVGRATLIDRLANRAAVDAEVAAWTSRRTIADCIAALTPYGIPCGPIMPIDGLAAEANIRHRQTLSHAPGAGSAGLAVGPPFRSSGYATRVAKAPGPRSTSTAHHASVAPPLPLRPPAGPARVEAPFQPLKGLTVVEIGHYTTAPLAARCLAVLGATTIKVEPVGGEAARKWPPARNGKGLFYALSNSGKIGLETDLRSTAGRKLLTDLIETADVVVENMRPGALAKLGFPTERLFALNPRLIYCPISGFGLDTAYPQRPAFDSVVQAMSGMMDATRTGAMPLKVGVSAADMAGGQLALVAILAAIRHRAANGAAMVLDVAMQDAAVWYLQSLIGNGAMAARTIACPDGVVVAHPRDGMADRMACDGASPLPADDLVAELARHGIAASPVLNVGQVAEAPATRRRGLIEHRRDEGGDEWPLLRSPIRVDGRPLPLGLPIVIQASTADTGLFSPQA